MGTGHEVRATDLPRPAQWLSRIPVLLTRLFKPHLEDFFVIFREFSGPGLFSLNIAFVDQKQCFLNSSTQNHAESRGIYLKK